MESTEYRTNEKSEGMEIPSGTGVYIQVPFCPERCDYCAIPVSSSQSMVKDYLDALERELARVRPYLSKNPPLSLYFGGGSPTSLPENEFVYLVNMFSTYFQQIFEVTIESRPEALTTQILEHLQRVPHLRLSLGMESLDSASLAALGRKAPSLSPVALLERIKSCLTAQVSMDFICTGEDFDVDRFLSTAEILREEGLDHLSVYPLVVEKQTVLSLRKDQGRTEEELEDRAAENWRQVCEGLVRQGWLRYEVSNFARDPERICRHNLHVWRGGDYVGLGPGAHQKIDGVRYENVRSVVEYVSIVRNESRHPFAAKEGLSARDRDVEFLYTNLRLFSGIPVRWILSRTNPRQGRAVIDDIVRNGLGMINRTDCEALVLTGEGLFLLDEVASRILACFSDD